MSTSQAPENYQEIIALFDELSILGAPERHQRLAAIVEDSVRAAVSERLERMDQLAAWRLIQSTDRYALEEKIGQGAIGSVYRARSRVLNQVVAIKVFSREKFANRDMVQPFLDAAKAAVRLEHLNIVRIHDAGIHDGQLFLAMDLVDGGSLRSMLRGQAIELSTAVRWMKGVADGVHHAHDCQLIHRDLKPDNLLIDGAGYLRVADFDLLTSAAQKAGVRQPSAPVGTPRYMAPELAEGRPATMAADVYSLGVILYEMLTGRLPFKVDTIQDLASRPAFESPPSIRMLNPRVSLDLETICFKCLRFDPDGRYSHAGELAGDLGRYLAGVPIKARQTPPIERMIKWAKRNRVVTALISAILLSLIAGLIVSTYQARRADRARLNSDRNLATSLEMLNFVNQNIVGRDLAQLAGTDRMRQEILTRSLQFYEGILAENPADNRSFDAAKIYLSMGDIQRSFGQLAEAESAYRQVLSLHPNWLEHGANVREDVAWSVLQALRNLLVVQMQFGKPETIQAAIDALDGALNQCPEVLKEQTEFVVARADLLLAKAKTLTDEGHGNEALLLCREAIAVIEQDSQRQPDHRHDWQLGGIWSQVGAIDLRSGRMLEAIEAYKQMASIFDQLAQDDPDNVSVQLSQTTAYRSMAAALKREGENKAAIAAYLAAEVVVEKLATRFPQLPGLQFEHSEVVRGVSMLLPFQETAEYQAKALSAVRNAHRLSPENLRYQQSMRRAMIALAGTQVELGHYDDALRLLNEFLLKPELGADFLYAAYFLYISSERIGMDTSLSDSERACRAYAFRHHAVSVLDRARREKRAFVEDLGLFEELHANAAFARFVEAHLQRRPSE